MTEPQLTTATPIPLCLMCGRTPSQRDYCKAIRADGEGRWIAFRCSDPIHDAADIGSLLLAAVRKHRDQKGDDRCWLDDRELYAVLPEGVADADLRLHNPAEMLRNCQRYIASRQDPSQSYVSPQRRIEELEAEVLRLKSKCGKLFNYVSHRRDCPTASRPLHRGPCTCGLMKIYTDINAKLELSSEEG